MFPGVYFNKEINLDIPIPFFNKLFEKFTGVFLLISILQIHTFTRQAYGHANESGAWTHFRFCLLLTRQQTRCIGLYKVSQKSRT